MSTRDSARERLLSPSRPLSSDSFKSIDSSEARPSRQSDEAADQELWLDRSVEADVSPDTSILGRNLGWSSVYIIIISRVIGSGIFATPGAIVRSVGSVGIALALW